ncbi:hypothetical protein O181_029129 [Austropuccinia psidii MF-1]|uniref:Uncharacterized protein n=1 Tax=Austropuccinia psidii MF-1 TaxID=1389203 RepID=A0A9Q3H498_9BASI|nr:hypothetical protein [Austropuccinia psidii MF-1]
MLPEFQKKDNAPVEAPQASTISKKRQGSPNNQQIGKGKLQMEQALSSELQDLKERKGGNWRHIQYGKKLDEVQKQGGGKKELILPKEIYFTKLT